METFTSRWERSNEQERQRLLHRSIKPLFVNKELIEFLAKVLNTIVAIEDKIFYLMICKKYISQIQRKPDRDHYAFFFDEYQNFFSEIEEEQQFNDPIDWINIQLNYLYIQISNYNSKGVEDGQKVIKLAEAAKTNEVQPKKDIIDPNRKWLTTLEMANYLGISKSSLDRLRPHGLPVKKLGRLNKFDPEEIDAWMATRTFET